MFPSLAREKRRGAVVVLVALMLLFVLMTMVAIDIDGGALLDARRHAQATADAAALAGAVEIWNTWSTNAGVGFSGAEDAAIEAAAENGYTGEGYTVTVNQNPEMYAEGPNAGTLIPLGYIEVIVEKQQDRYFSGIVGSGTILVKARAVARARNEPNGDGVIILDRDADAALNVHGNGVARINGTGKVVINSNSATAGNVTNDGATMYSEAGYSVVGSLDPPGRFTGGDASTASGPIPDPLRFLPDPTTLNPTAGTARVKNLPGGDGKTVYYKSSGGVTDFRNLSSDMKKFDPSYAGKINVEFEPGIYLFDQFEWTTQAGSYFLAPGVMIYVVGDGINDSLKLAGQGSVAWTPYNSATDYTYYNGMSLFMNRDSDSPMRVTGNGSFNITGLFYGANADARIEGNGDSSIGSQWISRTLDVGGNGNLNINYNASQPPGLRVLQLVE